MTIPITPGPFSFLAEAGQAVGTIGQALEAKRQRLDSEARQRLTDILTLIQAGADPGPFLSSGGAAAERLGLAPTGQGAAILSGPSERARLALKLSQDQERAASANATTAEAGAGVAGEMAQTNLATAKANQTTAEQQARSAPSTADLAISQNKMSQQIYDSTLKMLGGPGNEETKKLSQYAALGLLPYLTASMQLRYGRGTERTTLLRETLSDIRATFIQAHNQWTQGLQSYMTQLRLSDPKVDTPEGQQSALEAYQRQAGPEPTFEAVRDDYLKNTLHITPESFGAALRASVPALVGTPATPSAGAPAGGAGASATPSPATAPSGQAAPAPASQPSLEGMSSRGRALFVVQRLASNPKDPATGKPITPSQWMTSFDKNQLTDDELTMVYRDLINLDKQLPAEQRHPDLIALLAERIFNRPMK